MAITATLVRQSGASYVADLACLDADTGPTTFAHGLGQTPSELYLTPLVSLAAAAQGCFSVTADNANVSITKLNVAGSGGAVPGTTKVMRVTAKIPFSVT